MTTPKTCSVTDCTAPLYCKGKCSRHYYAQRVRGIRGRKCDVAYADDEAFAEATAFAASVVYSAPSLATQVH